MRVHMSVPENPEISVDMPWETPLAQWPPDFFVHVPRGISRNLVRFAPLGKRLLALKEIPDRVAGREYKLLRELQELNLPTVEPVALITERGQDRTLPGMLITRFLEYSLPYRLLLSDAESGFDTGPLLDAMVLLLVRLHLVGVHWGDCSLSNTLFRHDAGRLAAYLVDAETSEVHPTLSTNMRLYDVELTRDNIAGELMDVAAERGLPDGMDPIAVAEDFVRRYHALWTELNHDEVVDSHDHYSLEKRVRALNELGFDVDELELAPCDGGQRLNMSARVVEHGFHKRRLHALTGLNAEENQSKRLLNDIIYFHAGQAHQEDGQLTRETAARRWLADVYTPVVASVDPDLRGKLPEPEMYHQILEHRWFLSERAGRDIGTEEAAASYREQILPNLPNSDLTGRYLEETWSSGSENATP